MNSSPPGPEPSRWRTVCGSDSLLAEGSAGEPSEPSWSCVVVTSDPNVVAPEQGSAGTTGRLRTPSKGVKGTKKAGPVPGVMVGQIPDPVDAADKSCPSRTRDFPIPAVITGG